MTSPTASSKEITPLPRPNAIAEESYLLQARAEVLQRVVRQTLSPAAISPSYCLYHPCPLRRRLPRVRHLRRSAQPATAPPSYRAPARSTKLFAILTSLITISHSSWFKRLMAVSRLAMLSTLKQVATSASPHFLYLVGFTIPMIVTSNIQLSTPLLLL